MGSFSNIPCQICGSPKGQYHFGAITCRACAAFFRRYVNSKKLTISCKCRTNKVLKYPCRLCRLRKCESFGMKTNLVQPRREPNSPMKDVENSETCAENASVIEKPIALRTMERLENVERNYSILNRDRNSLRDNNKTMFTNFYTKWSLIECVLYTEKIQETWTIKTPVGHVLHPIEDFYISTRDEASFTQNDTIRIFKPYWTYFERYLVPQIYDRKLKNIEYMALLALSFLDPGYSTLSDKCAELCNKLRPLYLKELNAYYSEINHENSDNRFFDVLDILRLAEKGEVKAQEELQMCLVYDVLVNDEYSKLVMSQKY